MKELGDSADALHAEVGRYAREAGVQRLLAVGERAKFAVDAFGEGAQWFGDLDELIDTARASLTSGIAVLIKGSRANKLEKVSAALSLDPTLSEGH
jgi:UDP-N-acetylmuramoyl-tripeptide--D-alanyl-D-alanine ligase